MLFKYTLCCVFLSLYGLYFACMYACSNLLHVSLCHAIVQYVSQTLGQDFLAACPIC